MDRVADQTTQTQYRLAGLDIFRGAAVGGMILVNTPGSGDHIWWPLDHAAWHGFTPTDLVFPAFLFAMGVALGLSFPRRIGSREWLRIGRRMLALIAIGWAIQLLARGDLSHFRLMGVLPRIALTYGLAATLAILSARRDADGQRRLQPIAIGGAALAALLGYWALMALVPVPGHGAGHYTPEGNLAGYVDRVVLGTAHMWRFGTDAAGNIVYDPEGLFSTIPALANVLIGMLIAAIWRRDPGRAIPSIALIGLALIAAGLAVDPLFPINKRLWTTSFALLTAGLSALLLVLAILAARSSRAVKLLAPLHIFGMNAILAYVVSLLIAIAATKTGLQSPAFEAIRAMVGDPWLASFLFALAVVLAVLAMLVPLHRRGIHLRL